MRHGVMGVPRQWHSENAASKTGLMAGQTHGRSWRTGLLVHITGHLPCSSMVCACWGMSSLNGCSASWGYERRTAFSVCVISQACSAVHPLGSATYTRRSASAAGPAHSHGGACTPRTDACTRSQPLCSTARPTARCRAILAMHMPRGAAQPRAKRASGRGGVREFNDRQHIARGQCRTTQHCIRQLCWTKLALY